MRASSYAMPMNQKQIEIKINKAIDILFQEDGSILSKEYNLNERAITHRLAMYLEPLFCKKNYNVDVEYNRMRDEYHQLDDVGNIIGKRINFEMSGEGSRYVYPDIIIHKRDSNNNLIVIEVKMAWNNRKRNLDYKKLNEYVEQIGYKFGIYLELDEIREKCFMKFAPFLRDNL